MLWGWVYKKQLAAKPSYSEKKALYRRQKAEPPSEHRGPDLMWRGTPVEGILGLHPRSKKLSSGGRIDGFHTGDTVLSHDIVWGFCIFYLKTNRHGF